MVITVTPILLLCFLLIFTRQDCREMQISNRAFLIYIFVGMMLSTLINKITLWELGIYFLVGFILCLIHAKGAIGGGDIKVLFGVPFYLPLNSNYSLIPLIPVADLEAFFVFTGGFFITLYIIHFKSSRPIPLIPCFLISFLIVILF